MNGFVNAAFGQDKLLMEDGQKWLYKNREHGNNRSPENSFLFIYFLIYTLDKLQAS